MKKWQDIGFTVEQTMDGSPSLRKIQSAIESVLPGEVMHHSGGAWSETDLIYGEPLREVFANIEAPRVLSVGLGLGYVELLAARIAVEKQMNFELLSFESVPELREWFFLWLGDQELSSEVSETYDRILSFVANKNRGLGLEVKKKLLTMHLHKKWQIEGALSLQTFPTQKNYHVLLYDAFSGKTSPQLWEEDFLKEFLKKSANSDCLFSTYACRAALKNALRDQDFLFVQREGFMGKRNSSLGRKGLFRS